MDSVGSLPDDEIPISQTVFARANWDTGSVETSQPVSKEHEKVPESTLRKQWVNEAQCEGCGLAFGWVMPRPHHCRKCNKCFCWLCSIYLVEPDLVNIEASTEQRVCHDCYVALGGNGKIRMEQFSLPLATITQIERENTDVPLPARQQEVLAQMYLGIIGTGFQENHVRARELFQLAAALGHPSAMCNLGLLYQYGKGIAKDEDKALELFVAAAAKGSNQSKHNAGNLFYERQDYAAAAMYWEGVYESKYNLGYLYLTGRGVQQDFKKAHDLFDSVSKEGPESCKAVALYQLERPESCKAVALYQLGAMIVKGLSKDNDLQQAKKIFEESLHLGCSQAATELQKIGV